MLICASLVSAGFLHRPSRTLIYYPFSWSSIVPIRKQTLYKIGYDLSSLANGTIGLPKEEGMIDLETALNQGGAPCKFEEATVRLRWRSLDGREIWVDTLGCRQSENVPEINNTRLSRAELRNVKVAIEHLLPPRDSLD